MPNPNLRPRSSSLQTAPTEVSTNPCERSVVSALTPLNSPSAANSSQASIPHDAVEYNEIVHAENLRDMNGGDGGDSDVEGDEAHLHGSGVEPHPEEVVEFEVDGRGKTKGFVDLTNSTGGVMGSVILTEGNVTNVEMTNLMRGRDVKIAKPPDDWFVPVAKEARGEPKFEDVDNPGSWPQYCYRPVFDGRSRNSKYVRHALPTGAMPLPKNDEGIRKINDWEFHYNGWTNPGPSHRHGATTANMFPEEMDGCLDADVLKKLGLNKRRMHDTDALFFLQLILPICNPAKSGIEDDPRISYYHDVETHTNSTKFATGLGGSYGHNWTPTTTKELINFDGVLVRDGVLGGTQGALHCRWDKIGPCYSPDIVRVMTLTRFGELKRSIKLCNNYQCPKRGQRKYYEMDVNTTLSNLLIVYFIPTSSWV